MQRDVYTIADDFIYDEAPPSTHPIAIIYPDGLIRAQYMVERANEGALYREGLRQILGLMTMSHDRSALLDRIRATAMDALGDE